MWGLPALVCILAGFLSVACTSIRGTKIPEGGRVLVLLHDGGAGTLLELANESHPDWRGIYSRQQASANLKLVPEPLLAELLDSLEDAGFSRLARPGPPPHSDASLRGWLSIRREGVDSTFEVPRGNWDRQILGAFAQMKLLVNECYSSVAALQFVENPEAHDYFDRFAGRRGGKP
jgi:hypothetical protein